MIDYEYLRAWRIDMEGIKFLEIVIEENLIKYIEYLQNCIRELQKWIKTVNKYYHKTFK